MMAGAGKFEIGLGEDPSIERIGSGLRTLAALGGEGGVVQFSITPAVARKVAHHLDGGGYHAAREAEQAAAANAAAMAQQVEASEREAWVTKCQRMMDKARRDNRQAQVTLALALLIFLGAVSLLLRG